MEVQGTYDFLQLNPDTDPSSVFAALEADERPRRIQVSEPVPVTLLDAIAKALATHPEVGLRFYGFYAEQLKDVDPALRWLERFCFVRDLSIELSDATSFEVLSSFTNLRRLSLG